MSGSAPSWKIGLVGRTLLATAFLGIALASIFVLLATAINNLQDTNDAARRAGDVLAGANGLERTALDLQTNLYGYLITRHSAALRAYDEAKTTFDGEAKRIGDLIVVPKQDERLREIARLVETYEREYADPLIERVQNEEVAGGARRRATRRGDTLVEDIRRKFEVFLEEEEEILTSRRAEVDDEGDEAVVFGLAAAALTLLLLLLIAYIVERSVARPVTAVAREARRVARGDLSARVPVSGAAEVGELSFRFNEMAAGLEASEKMKDEFFALVSHELRTPLTSIIGYTEILREELSESEDGERMLDFVERIERGAIRLSRLVGDLLFVAEVEAGKLSITLRDGVDLAAVANLSADGLRHRVKNHGQTMEVNLEPVSVRGDADRLGQVTDNLVANAIKFTPEGGKVCISVARENGEGVLTVSDTGIGIPKEEQERLFERFFRASTATRGEIQGVGLGLSIVKAIVEGHGGSVSVESEEGTGTSFVVRLPAEVIGDAVENAEEQGEQ